MSVDETFATIRAGAGNSHNDTATTMFPKITTSTTTNQFSQIARCIISFDTSSLSPDVVQSADISFYGLGKSDTFTPALNPDYYVVSATPADAADLADADYGNTGSTSFGTFSQSGFNTSAYNDVALNASGQANINTSGVSSFGLRIGPDFLNSAPAWGSLETADVSIYTADQTGTTNDPKLTVIHGAAAGETKAPGVSVGSNHMFIY